MNGINNKLEYTVFEKLSLLRPVNRLDFLANKSQDKVVMDIGALDETAYKSKKGKNLWLHERLSKKAKRVIGIDSSDLIERDSIKTFDNAEIFKRNIYDVEEVSKLIDNVDIIIAGEVIEHLDNPIKFMEILKQYGEKSQGKVYITTPNAQSYSNHIMGLIGRESCHKDHLTIFSYKTLNTLCIRTHQNSWRFYPTYTKYYEMIENSKGFKRVATIVFNKYVNIIEYLFPMLCGCWILELDYTTQ